MKKILSLILCILINFTSFACALEGTPSYDFSDEAQEEFNKSRQIQVVTPLPDTKIKKEKGKVTKNQNVNENVNAVQENIPDGVVLPNVFGSNESEYQGFIITVPKGSTLTIKLQSGISSGSLDVRDQIMAYLAEDWTYNNCLIAPKDSLVYGVVTEVTPAGHAYGGGAFEIAFNRIVTPDGTFYEIGTERVKLSKQVARAKNVTRDILVGTGIGILGGAVGLLSGNVATSAVLLGAGVLGGTATALNTRGEDANLQADMPIRLILSRPVNVAPYQYF